MTRYISYVFKDHVRKRARKDEEIKFKPKLRIQIRKSSGFPNMNSIDRNDQYLKDVMKLFLPEPLQ